MGVRMKEDAGMNKEETAVGQKTVQGLWQTLRSGRGLEKLLGRRAVLWAGAMGALVLLAFSFAGGADRSAPAADGAAAQPQALEVGQYEAELEARLTQLLSQVEGAGQVSVMVTLESTAQTVYAQAYAETDDSTSGQQSGESRRFSRSTDYVLIGDGGSRQALEETTLQPTVKGVAVVCTGAESARVVSRMTQLVSTVMGLPSSRICVTG